jgi:diguanylate cyclase (GGDEF)-like protein/putative nucleotidyltransferase with HDIG domain
MRMRTISVLVNAPRRQPVTTFALVVAVAAVVALSIALLVQLRTVGDQSSHAQVARTVSSLYTDARFQLMREETEEARYLNEASPSVRDRFAAAGAGLATDLHRVRELDPASRRFMDDLLLRHGRFREAVLRMFAAVDDGAVERAEELDEHVADPAFDRLQERFNAQATTATLRAERLGTDTDAGLRRIFSAGTFTISAAVAIFLALGLLLRRERRRVHVAWEQELERVSEAAMTDPLTGLHNHRAFQEDLARELQRVSRTGLPLALMVLDIDDLKALNDAQGHQAGDDRLRTFADALQATIRGADCAYRTGGDEFAVILPDTAAAGAVELADRLSTPGFSSTAGITDTVEPRHRDDVLREAGLAQLAARRIHQPVAVYSRDMLAIAERPDEQHKRVLAAALARAVDAKDSYTRSHCQTVSQLASTIAGELGFDGERLNRLRLAGLLHDVGKIGIPDAILNKPSKLTDEEYEQMKRHSLLGFDIVDAAGLHTEARWVRHHHERVDGGGYPDGLAGDEIPLESRIILVADAFEAMTSDRPYRKAPGREFALEELRRGAGSQFDPAVVEALERALSVVPLQLQSAG